MFYIKKLYYSSDRKNINYKVRVINTDKLWTEENCSFYDNDLLVSIKIKKRPWDKLVLVQGGHPWGCPSAVIDIFSGFGH